MTNSHTSLEGTGVDLDFHHNETTESIASILHFPIDRMVACHNTEHSTIIIMKIKQ